MTAVTGRGCLWAALVGGTLLVATGAVQAQTVGATVSIFAVRGTYATETTDGLYLFTGVDAAGGPVRLAVSFPLMRVESNPLAPLPDGTPSFPYSSTGVGDPLLRGDVRIVNDTRRGLQVSVAGAAKFGVVQSTSGRGTGEHDLGAGGSAFAFRGRTSLMADVMFWHYGDPDGVDYEDGLSYSVGAGRLIGSGRWSVLGSVAGFSNGIEGASPPVSVGVSLLGAFSTGQSVAVSASVGLNESASDFSVGVSWRIAQAVRSRSARSGKP